MEQINVRNLNMNELYKLYRQDKNNYEVIMELNNQVERYCYAVLKRRNLDNHQELAENCIADFWMSISDKREKNIDITVKNYSIVSYFEKIISGNIAKYFSKHRGDYGEYYVEYSPTYDDDVDQESVFFQDNSSVQQLNMNHLMDAIIDCLTRHDFSQEHINWFWLYVNGHKNVEIASVYGISASYVGRIIKEMISLIRELEEFK